MKDENKVKEFMEEQRKLAKRAARALKVKKFKIYYHEVLPSLRRDPETEKEYLLYPCQRQLSNSHISGGSRNRQRIEVWIYIKGNIKDQYRKKLDKVMSRYYEVRGNWIIYSVKPFH